ncbi:uncharacterized protein [Haliotis asinina]|uniref:uncharacterized protein n=1 Tax=Haliotis asinina TaxID=109174 RepID=UPI00353213C6
MHFVLRTSRTLNLSIQCQLYLFDSMVKPILMYGCEIWGYVQLKQIENVHICFIRKLLPVKKRTPLFMLYGELGRVPLSVDVKTRMVTFWSKLCTKNSPKLSSILYSIVYNLHNEGTHGCSWVPCIETILNNIGLRYVWLSQSPISTSWIKNTAHSILIDNAIQLWSSEVDSSPKGQTYSLMKPQYEFERYLPSLPFNKVIPLLHFRSSCHHLPVEKGRWNRIPRDERKCKLCCLNDVGDEFHYIFKCIHFRKERSMYIPSNFVKRPNMLKFRSLFTCKKIPVLRNLSKFCKCIMQTVKTSS